MSSSLSSNHASFWSTLLLGAFVGGTVVWVTGQTAASSAREGKRPQEKALDTAEGSTSREETNTTPSKPAENNKQSGDYGLVTKQGTVLDNAKERFPAPRRYGAVIRLKPEHYQRYRELHDCVWEHVLQRMYQSNIRNFTIYYHKDTGLLFQHFEWIGHWKQPAADVANGNNISPLKKMTKKQEEAQFAADMDEIAADPEVQDWWKECEPCQEPFNAHYWKNRSKPSQGGGKGADWWAPMECLTHCGHWPVSYTEQNRDPDFERMVLPHDPADLGFDTLVRAM